MQFHHRDDETPRDYVVAAISAEMRLGPRFSHRAAKAALNESLDIAHRERIEHGVIYISFSEIVIYCSRGKEGEQKRIHEDPRLNIRAMSIWRLLESRVINYACTHVIS